jgi:hypothetical protein
LVSDAKGAVLMFKGSETSNRALQKYKGQTFYNGKVSAPKNNCEGFPMFFVIP